MKQLYLLLLCVCCISISANEVGFDEQFNLAQNRQDALKKLIPGTPEYYYYHSLYYQHKKDYKKVHETLESWIKRHGKTSQVAEIKNRQILLEYKNNPQESIKHIIDELGLSFFHQKRQQQMAKQYPSKLDNKLVSYEKLFKDALSTSNNGLHHFETKTLDFLVNENLSPDRRRSLLKKLTRPDHERLPMIVVEDLKHRYSGGFGSISIHNKLLLSQLDACLKRMPKLIKNTNFVHTYLRKLHPSNDKDWQLNLTKKSEYINRLWDFVKNLPEAQNSLKAHVLYHKLRLQSKQEKYSKNLFLVYLKLPRNAAYSNRNFLYHAQHKVNLHQNYQKQTQLHTIGDDTELVRQYLQQFLLNAENYEEFETYIDSNYLKALFAEIKIVYGVGNAIDWYSLLTTQKYKELQERVDLDFLPTNKDIFTQNDNVRLQVAVKNVQNLIVKTYFINTKNYYLKHKKEITTAIDLDGLVANHEQRFSFKQVPLRRHHEQFNFPQIKKNGTYIIEFIGNGQSNRALIRKGSLTTTERIGSAGHVFSIYNENNSLLKNATILFSGSKYEANKQGEITIPFSNRPNQKTLILYHDNFAQLHKFYHHRENYKLTAGIYINRETILHKNKCRVIVRPQLFVNNEKISVDILEEVELTIKTTNRDGITSSIKMPNFILKNESESKYEFKVPEKMSKVEITLNAKVMNLSQGKKQQLRISKSIKVNGIDSSASTENLYLRKVSSGYQVEFLGKTGEPRPNRVLQVSCKHHYFTNKITINLQTDNNGRLYLGQLRDVDHITIGGKHTWHLEKDRRSYPQTLHGTTDKPLYVPIMASKKSIRNLCSLLEIRGQEFVADMRSKISIDNHYLKIEGLKAGDYSLLLKDSNTVITIRLTQGKINNDYIVGNNRYLQTSKQKSLQIKPLTSNEKTISVQLLNFSKTARVHVIATHFIPQENIYNSLGENLNSSLNTVSKYSPNSLYLSGRNIGEEYRYILERKYATKFPGNMLTRPSLLLNPWSLRKTETGIQHAKQGSGWGESDNLRAGAYPSRSARSKLSRSATQSGNYNFNFLANSALILTNLKPDDEGKIEISVSSISPRQHVHVVAIDNDNIVYRQLALPRSGKQYKDLRLIYALDSEKHFIQQKNISAVRSGRLFNISDITTAEIEVYDSLQNIHSFYTTLTNNATLKEFQFILRWPQLTVAQKNNLYSKYSCHELNFFLYKKDHSFFLSTIKPYLHNKKDKTFLDHWLLGSDLSQYLQPWKYQRLNIVERILLGQILTKEAPQIARQIADMCDLQPVNLDRFNRVFTTGIQNTSLDTRDALGLSNARNKAPRKPSAIAELPSMDDEYEEASEDFFDASNESKKTSESRLEKLQKRRFKRDKDSRKKNRQFYRKEDKTREWVENNYYHLPIEKQIAKLITANSFWKDYAAHASKQPFLSTHFISASKNFSEMMFALSVLDLPFTAGKHQIEYVEEKMSFSSDKPAIILHQEIKEVAAQKTENSILINQSFFARDDRYAYKNNERYDKFVREEFATGRVYGCQIVLTNPTSSRRKLDVLLQIPSGSMPVINGFYTKSFYYELGAYTTHKMEFYFYFPVAGKFSHYPVHVAQNSKLIAWPQPFTFQVVDKLSTQDTNSWNYISQNGSADQVIDYLRNQNLYRANLNLIAFRMRDKAFFDRAIAVLQKRRMYNTTLWSYGFLHRNESVMKEFLPNSAYAQRCGKHISSALLTIEPIVRNTYQHKEYWPLIHPRVYQLGQKRQILNQQFFQQYQAFQEYMRYRSAYSNDDLVTMVIYLLLQDRVEESLAIMKRIDREALDTKIQVDYLQAYLHFYLETPEKAMVIAKKYQDYPIERWQFLFRDIIAQVQEISNSETQIINKEDRNQKQTQLAASEPSFDFVIEKQKISVKYQNLENCEIHYYPMDIELLFSRKPFVQEVSGQFSVIHPNHIHKVSLTKAKNLKVVDIPKEYREKNVMVEVVAAGQSKMRSYYPHALNLQMIEKYGQLKLTHIEGNKPLSKVYIKVYARSNNGNIQFYKDGYTDLRGRFDYASLNTNELDSVSRFSILILSEEHGAMIREVAPPKM